jgi:ABC-type multidrug transport system permease subunit
MTISEPGIAHAQAERKQAPGFRSRPPRRNGRWSGFLHLLRARTLELKREPEIIFWLFGFPLLLALGLGIAFRNKPVSTTSVAVIESPAAARTLALLQASPEHSTGAIRATVLDREAALEGFRFGKFDLVIEPAPDGSVIYHYDPSRPESVLSRSEIDNALQTAAGRKDAMNARNQPSSEPGSRYIDFLIPGLLGMNLMNSGMWCVGFALVDMRQRKLIKRFVATPMRRTDFLLSVLASWLGLMVAEVGVFLGFGALVFHMPVLGSVASVLLLGTLGAVAFGGIGLLTACRAQKIESVSGLINLITMPMWVFSGVFFSYQHFPAIAQPLLKALPLTALNDALRASILEGATLASQSGRLLVLVLWGGISFVLALRWFRWA